jgi:hypothetical protein
VSKAATLRDLKKSGLTAVDFKKLQVQILTPAQNVKLTGKRNNVPGYLIPYFDIHSKPIKGAWRRRNLETPIGPLGGLPQDPGKWRYRGPDDELPHLYYPLTFGNWAGLADDVGDPIFITEGEKKAACMCKNGLATIAVPGVWGWRAGKKGVDLLQDFDCISWKGRRLILVFDNDILTNENVIQALNAFSNKMLTAKGADVYIKTLPAGNLKGVDDYIVEKGVESFIALPEDQFSEKREIFELNKRLAFIDGQSFVYDLKTARNYNTKQRLQFQFAHLKHFELVDDELKQKNTIDVWHDWPAKRMYKDICYSPGKDEVHNNKLNIWPGWSCEPKKGNVKPFLMLIALLFGDEDVARKWFLQWLAYPLKHPGTKLFSGVMLWSRSHGIGKSFLGLMMKRIYGDNFTEVSKADLTSAFNPWRIGKQFILGDEITGSDNRKEADALKGFITAEDFQANLKNQGQYPLRSCENYFLTSNHENALYLEDDDRRFLVHGIKATKPPPEWYAPIDKWMRGEDGPAALFYYLINDVDLSDFKPFAGPPVTESKREMVEASKTWVEVRLADMIENPQDYFEKLGIERDVFTPSELLAFFDDNKNINAAYLGRMCQRFELPKKSMVRIKYPRPGTRRLYAIRNIHNYIGKTPQAWAENYEIDFQPDKYKKGNRK